MDFGATDHINSSLNFLKSYTEIKPIFVKLPNGNYAFACFSRTVEFGDHWDNASKDRRAALPENCKSLFLFLFYLPYHTFSV